MTYQQQLNELLLCQDIEGARVWLIREIKRYEEDYAKPPELARKQIMGNVINTALGRGLDVWHRVCLLMEP